MAFALPERSQTESPKHKALERRSGPLGSVGLSSGAAHGRDGMPQSEKGPDPT